MKSFSNLLSGDIDAKLNSTTSQLGGFTGQRAPFEHPSITSKKEYQRNKAYRSTNISMVKPETDSHMDKRCMETSFFKDLEKHRVLQVARDVKAVRLNRRQMSKNAPLVGNYEPIITTKKVEAL